MKTVYLIWLRLLLLTVLVLAETAVSAQLKAGFTAAVRSGCPPMFVSFTDSSDGNPTSWKWDLGNGTISYAKDPKTTYFNSGSYTIKLIVTNANSSDTITRSKYIVVSSVPVPQFGASDSSGCFPLNVRFTDKSLASSGTLTEWKWDFGDGTLSKEQNPAHTYTSAGSFTVVLSVTNSNGCSKTISKSSYINLQNGVKASFNYTSPSGCHAPTSVNFINETSGTGGTTRYTWDFGNGKTSAEENPVNKYDDAGVYTVKLIAVSSLGCTDTLIKPNAINIGFVKANFAKPDIFCSGTAFRLTNTSTPSTFVSSFWDFGDGTFSNSANPAKTYDAPGTYRVKLVTDFGSCRDSIFKSVTVLQQPAASFTATNNTGCTIPLTVTFSNTSNNSVSYVWDFGDSTISTLENPVHTYTKAGSYTVTLVIKNAAGCYTTSVKQDFVKTIGPKITGFKNLPFKGCVPATVTTGAIIDNNLPGSTFLWNFGDGTTSTDSVPSHTYTTPGNYNVKLTVTTAQGCTDTLTVKKAVQVGNKPAAQFSADPLDVCAATPVTFTDLSTGAPAQTWAWTFGDGATSSEQNPVHSFGNAGKVTVTLVAFNFGCSDTLKKVAYINVRPPIAKFDTAFRCNDPLTRNFLNKSIGAITSQWSFGDGANSIDSNVTHTYAAPGIYPVVLKVTNGGCEATIKKDVVIIKEQGALGINITESCINTNIVFNIANVNTANIGTYTWYFNGLSSQGITSGITVTSVYSTAGVRYPAAVLTNKLSCRDTLYAAVPVTIYGAKAAFGSSNPGTCLGNTVGFTDSTVTDGTHPVASWVWNFGEGASQAYTSSPFSHTYSKTGNYDVKLIVKDSYGCTDSVTKVSFISVTKSVAAFTASDTAICPKAPITFNNTSQGADATYFWQFGDGITSNDVSPAHTYAEPGFYTVSMLMNDKNGCSDSTFKNIKVSTATAAFAMSDSFSTCPPLTVNITNKSENFIKLNWDFGDGGNSQLQAPSHVYTYPGNYTVKLLINNNGGCSDSLIRKVVIEGPTGVFDYSPKEACNFGTTNFSLKSQNAVNYIWDFDDGTAVASDSPSQSHRYITAGAYMPKIILENTTGCKVPLTGPDTIKIYGINANISSDAKIVCDSGFIAFRDSTVSNDVVDGWMWNFGDGAVSSVQSPDHKFTNAGLYTVTLIAKSRFGCADTAISRKYIKVVSSPLVQISGDTSACEPAQLSFQGEFVRKDTGAVTWKWNFGNGKTADVINPDAQTFATAGTYPVTVKVTNSDGCYDSVVRYAVIHPKPPVNAGADTAICKFTTFNLHAAGADKYTWSAVPSLSCTNCANPAVKPDQTSTFYVLGKSVFGCTNKDSVTVKVQQPFKITVSKDDTLCHGESVVLQATGADRYKWTPSRWLDNANTATPKSTPDSTVTYKVVAQDSLGCFNIEGSVKLKVYPKPAIEITNGDNIIAQLGSSVKLSTKNSPDIITWKWNPGKWLSCTSCAEPIATPVGNVTYHVTAANEGQCEAQDEVTVSVICNNSNIYVPNTFSPNNDGSNDIFYPRGTGLYSIKSFKIFNRWGQMVFAKGEISANNPQYGWDGTLNGIPLPADVYVYMMDVVCSNNATLPVRGNITLVR